jgi:hypothetical protein
MNKKTWKHKEQNHVISDESLNKLQTEDQQNYDPSDENPTHEADDAGILSLIAAMVAEGDGSDGAQSVGDDIFGDFKGGNTGGAGAGGSFDGSDVTVDAIDASDGGSN